MRCGEACKDAETRAVWGCDRDSSPGGYSVPCWRCGANVDRACPSCGGAGRIAPTRCPTVTVTDAALECLRAWVWRGEGLLPEAGGMLDQTESFLAACAVLSRLDAYYDRGRRDG